MEEFEAFDVENIFTPSNMVPSRALICLRYEGISGQARQILDDSILLQALRQLENNAAHIAEVVVDRFPGRLIPNSWGSDFVSGALGSPLAHAISTRPQTVGIGEDLNGQLLVSAAMSGVLAFCAPQDEISRGRGRISILGHDVHDIRHSWLKSLSQEDKNWKAYDADDDFDVRSPIAEIVPRVHLAKGRFWDTVHFDARTNYALAIREFEKAEIDVIPVEGIINEICREAANAVASSPSTVSLDALSDLQAAYRLPVTDEIFLLPTSGMAAPLISDWPPLPGRYDPDPFETIMPVVLSNSVAITVPNGFSAEGLPMGLTLAGPAKLSARLLALAQWFQHASPHPTVSVEQTPF